jgi:signal transduction histidine kinase/CheY-like chemotaxis protein
MTGKTLDTLKRPIRFQNVIMHVATEFINCNKDDFDRVIQDAFALVGSFLDVDRVYLFTYDFDAEVVDNTHEWCNTGISAEIDNLRSIPFEGFFEGWVDQHMQGREVNIPDVMALDPDNQVRMILEPQGVLSVLTLPLKFGDQLLGFVGFDDNRQNRIWKDEEFKLLKVLAEMLTHVLIRFRNEEEIIEMREAAIRASQAKGRFLASVSHEIRTPLSGIYNAIYLLQTTNMTIEQKQYINIAQSSIETLSGIVDDVLDLSKIEAGKMDVYDEVFDLEHEIVKVMNIQSFFASDKNLEFTLDYDYTLNHAFSGDAQKVRQILLNLLSNAIKYTDEGSVSVSVKDASDQDGSKVRIDVTDTGIGISERDRAKLFDMFYQVDSEASRKYPGTGLGLSIVRQLSVLLGGTVDVRSTLDNGTTFEVVLPLEPVEALAFEHLAGSRVRTVGNPEDVGMRMLRSMGAIVTDDVGHEDILLVGGDVETLPQKASDAVVVRCCGSGNMTEKTADLIIKMPVSRRMIDEQVASIKTDSARQTNVVKAHDSGLADVLIVDDNAMNRLALGVILKKHGFSIREAESGEEAVSMVRRHHFDLVLMDVQMPGMDGYQTTREIRKLAPRFRHLPVIAVTANVFADDMDVYNKSGMNDIVFKPVRVDQLLSVIRKYVERTVMVVVPRHLRTFNRIDFNRRFEGSEAIAREVVETFLSEYRKDLESVRIVALEKNADMIAKNAHYFKGSVGYVSGERVLWLLNRMIDMAREGTLEHIGAYYGKLELEVYELAGKLEVDVL